MKFGSSFTDTSKNKCTNFIRIHSDLAFLSHIV